MVIDHVEENFIFNKFSFNKRLWDAEVGIGYNNWIDSIRVWFILIKKWDSRLKSDNLLHTKIYIEMLDSD